MPTSSSFPRSCAFILITMSWSSFEAIWQSNLRRPLFNNPEALRQFGSNNPFLEPHCTTLYDPRSME